MKFYIELYLLVSYSIGILFAINYSKGGMNKYEVAEKCLKMLFLWPVYLISLPFYLIAQSYEEKK